VQLFISFTFEATYLRLVSCPAARDLRPDDFGVLFSPQMGRRRHRISLNGTEFWLARVLEAAPDYLLRTALAQRKASVLWQPKRRLKKQSWNAKGFASSFNSSTESGRRF
jgi:hypothetical protein